MVTLILAFAWSLLLGPYDAEIATTETPSKDPAAMGPPDSEAAPPLGDARETSRRHQAALRDAMARLPSAPSLESIQRAAVMRARIDPVAARRWITRARAAAALPTFTANYDRHVDNGWALDQEAGSADDYSSDVGAAHVIKLRATWELDRLVFNPDELRASRAQLDVLDWRNELLVQVTQLYFEHRRLSLERIAAPGDDLDESLAREMRILEIEGLLSAMTGVAWR